MNCAIYFLRENKMGRKMCAICHNIFYDKSTLNRHVNNLHGAGCDACNESKVAKQRQSDLVYRDGSSDKNLHDESETVSADKFDFSSQIGGLYDEDAPLNPLPNKYGEDDDAHSGRKISLAEKTIKTLCLTTTICQTSKKSSCSPSFFF